MEQSSILVRIKELRKHRGWSQSEMAERLNVALKTYQNLESGITRIDIERLGQVASILGVELIDLLGYQPKPEAYIDRFINEEKALYHKIIQDKEAYIKRLEENLKVYQDILQRSSDDSGNIFQ
ncbi:helix-turn-helix domain-containing protein [Parapedobacter lycopersici]|uniref:helix-turn-helix domain-containing protein n=1 Tax=Parapedobacter lycopersici TaxID=1864939 RepID=UPI00214D7C2B|nr:helix-turn-helix transcriptional regulator [Parapedobacter lycopersici]